MRGTQCAYRCAMLFSMVPRLGDLLVVKAWGSLRLRSFVHVALGAAVAVMATAAPGCASPSDDVGGVEGDVTQTGKIQLLVTVDWEGRDLEDANLQAMQGLHARFPQ